MRLVGPEGGDEAAQAVAQEVVAEVHDEGRVADEVRRSEDRVGEAGGLVLDDVGDLGPELGAVAGRLADLVAGLRRDDDPDLLHPGVDQRLDPVEEHGLVGDGHELLRRGVGDRAQPSSGAAREDESLQWLHARLQPYLLRERAVRPAVYIPNFNGSERIGRALRSLREQSRPVDVIVVDNGSSDGSLALLHDEFPEVTVLALERNLGFGPALNRAVAEHPADPLILLNNDAECEPRFVEALLDAASEGVRAVAG